MFDKKVDYGFLSTSTTVWTGLQLVTRQVSSADYKLQSSDSPYGIVLYYCIDKSISQVTENHVDNVSPYLVYRLLSLSAGAVTSVNYFFI